MRRGRVTALSVSDVRFPTSLAGHGSDAMHPDPDYSAAYVVIHTDAPDGLKGYGLTFTLGKGTEVVVCAVNALSVHVVNKELDEIICDFRSFYRQLTSDGQLRWPLWKLLVDMDPKQLLSCIDFRYITDALTEEEAYTILQNGLMGKKEREEQMLKYGYPAYTTSCAWLGYPDQQLKQLCTEALKDGWTRFKVKVGADLQDDIRRCRLIREMIGHENILMLDANQRWEVEEAIEWVTKLAEFKPLWIEEPTSPDDILGHATISKCHNRVVFKQLLQAQALSYVQVDSCRLGSVNENLSVLLMAKKFESKTLGNALVALRSMMCEYVDHLHEHFRYPVVIKNASYLPPQAPGYSSEMKEDSIRKYQFPQGEVWQKLVSDHHTANTN
ncbi:hypothetical protein JD844_016383 [Phrynosoma platyrhinos]|uniref:Mandelate racemase/muconate lactonizing enzyme C-terminal domain-containing protein n=1 Tax=Phrynosoma platyrhinos TaxID=52577 RepID=A0ABQ7SKB4_PHRPL|nr:hypothetical protein JD844_016383 [Phrynosoma platyrhinos]